MVSISDALLLRFVFVCLLSTALPCDRLRYFLTLCQKTMLRGARVGTHANVVHSKFVIQKMLTPAETRVSSTCLALESRHISVPLSVFKQRVVHKARIDT